MTWKLKMRPYRTPGREKQDGDNLKPSIYETWEPDRPEPWAIMTALSVHSLFKRASGLCAGRPWKPRKAVKPQKTYPCMDDALIWACTAILGLLAAALVWLIVRLGG